MTPVALKAMWTVRGGIIPGQPIEEYTRTWHYASTDYEDDGKHAMELHYQPIFVQRGALAAAYYFQLTNPHALNWAEVSFVWL